MLEGMAHFIANLKKMFNNQFSEKANKEEQNIESTENNEKVDYNYEKQLKLSIGSFQEAPKFIQDNEYIKNGYILYCNTYKKTFLSLFICHNETVNIWSHLLGALYFIFLIWYTSHYISNFNFFSFR